MNIISLILDKEFLLLLIEKLREKYSTTEELIPQYSEREIEELLKCIERIYSSGYYDSFEERISGILFNITRGHYLNNGNKRVATMFTLIAFNIEIDVDAGLKAKYKKMDVNIIKDLALKIAEGSMDKEETLRQITLHLTK